MHSRTQRGAQAQFLLLPSIDGSAQFAASNESHAADIGQVCAADPAELTPCEGGRLVDALHRRFFEMFAEVE